jgi:hypothetical protein
MSCTWISSRSDMALSSPPWILAPDFQYRETSVGPVFVPTLVCPAEPSRILIVISSVAGPISIARIAADVGIRGITIPTAAFPFEIDFGTYGPLASAEWWFNSANALFVFEVFWRPLVSGR